MSGSSSSSTSTSPFRQKSKTLGYKSSPKQQQQQLAEQEEKHLEEEEQPTTTTHRSHSVHSTTTTVASSSNINNSNRSHSSTLRKQYFRHCRTDSEIERENDKRMSKKLQASNSEERWKKHQSMRLDPLERIGSHSYSTCSSESNRNFFSKFISKLSKKKSANNLF